MPSDNSFVVFFSEGCETIGIMMWRWSLTWRVNIQLEIQPVDGLKGKTGWPWCHLGWKLVKCLHHLTWHQLRWQNLIWWSSSWWWRSFTMGWFVSQSAILQEDKERRTLLNCDLRVITTQIPFLKCVVISLHSLSIKSDFYPRVVPFEQKEEIRECEKGG